MSKQSLRHAAVLAKERMKTGYWKESREPNVSRISETPGAVFLTNQSQDDPEFTAKVQKILDSEEQIMNPIRLLLDARDYEKADYAAKQKMILETSARFHRVRKELERQRDNV